MLSALVAVALAAALGPLDWEIRDTTDNITGIRTVEAQALSINAPRGREATSAWIECKDGNTVLQWGWNSRLPAELQVVSAARIDANASSDIGEPAVWKVWHGDTTSYAWASPEMTKRIAAASKGASLVLLTMHNQGSGTEYQFKADGMQAAYDRVSRYCLPR
jgi:hypothetical protein